MSARTRGWVALAGTSAVLLVTAGALGPVVAGPVGAWPLVLVSWPVVGGLVVARRPASLVGRLLVLFGTGFAAAIAVEYYLAASIEVWQRSPAELALWLSGWIYTPMFPILVYLVAVFPSDQVASRWMRWPLGAAVVSSGVLLIAKMVLPIPVATEANVAAVNPWALDELAFLVPAQALLSSATSAVLVVAVLDLALRWHRSSGIERLQMRWLALALLLFALLLLASGAVRLAGPSEAAIGVADAVAWLSGLGLLPVAIGVAATRHRLFEIDRLLSRTVTYAAVVAMLVTVYAGGVIVLGNLVPPQSDLGVAASTLTVAALFLPLRRRVQAIVDRRFNRSHYDAEQQLQRFAGRLRDELDLDDLSSDLLGVVATTVQPSTAAVWIREDR